MKKSFILKLSVFLSIFIYNSSGYADQTFPYVAEITANKVNVRSGPSTNFEFLAQLQKEDKVTIWDQTKEWVKIDPPENVVFWVHSRLIDGNLVNAYSVNVRTKPNLNSAVACQIEKGDQVNVVEIKEDWISIKPPPGAHTWVHNSFVKFYSNYDEYIENQIQSKQRKEIDEKLNHLWEIAENYEREQYFKNDEEIDFNAIREKYIEVIDLDPTSDYAREATGRLQKASEKESQVQEQILLEEEEKKKNELLKKELRLKEEELQWKQQQHDQEIRKLRKHSRKGGVVRYDGKRTR